jgi:L-asparaginase II
MSNPRLIEVTRGALVESVHHGALAVADAEGRPLLALGDCERPIYPRSAIKIMQAVPLLTTGTADALGFGDAELALACASHSGEQRHVEVAGGMLARAGLDLDALECGAHPPLGERAVRALMERGERPSQLHNNCSGKHAGMLATARHLGENHAGYVTLTHPVQVRVRAAVEAIGGAAVPADCCGVDGCSAPNFAMPLARMATGFARLAAGTGLPAEFAAAGDRLLAAAMREPGMVAGEGRYCTRLMAALPGAVFVKTGAEGVYCGAVPDKGLGFALKIDDGAGRAAEILTGAVVAALLPAQEEVLQPFRESVIRNVRGTPVGAIRLAAEVPTLLAELGRAAG